MKTLKQIHTKSERLKNKLRASAICENFGDKEIRQLRDYIGDIYSYSYDDRLDIIAEQRAFDYWCMSYTGK